MACKICGAEGKENVELGRKSRTQIRSVPDPNNPGQFTNEEVIVGWDVRMQESCTTCGYIYKQWTDKA